RDGLDSGDPDLRGRAGGSLDRGAGARPPGDRLPPPRGRAAAHRAPELSKKEATTMRRPVLLAAFATAALLAAPLPSARACDPETMNAALTGVCAAALRPAEA